MNTAETLVSTNISQSVFFHMKIIVTILQMCKFCHRTSVGQTNDDLYLLPGYLSITHILQSHWLWLQFLSW